MHLPEEYKSAAQMLVFISYSYSMEKYTYVGPDYDVM